MEPIRHKWERPIYAYVGGLHMKDEQDSGFIQEQARYIQEHIQFVYTGHCTGKLSYQRLKTSLGKRIQPLTTGQRIVL